MSSITQELDTFLHGEILYSLMGLTGEVIREKDGRTNEFTVTVSDMIQPGDIITINQRFF